MSPLLILAVKALAGGTLVSLSAVLGEMVSPKTLAGIFAASPSVAIASLGVTVLTDGGSAAGVQALGMIGGAVALVASCITVSRLMEERNGAGRATMIAIVVWLGAAMVAYLGFIRT